MSLQDTVSAERLHIGFFGMRNAGKSSVVNAVTGQDLAVVSDVKGTTTDPVKKAMELLPLGPVVIIDTPGLDDEGTLGEKRMEKARRILAQTDVAVLVVDAAVGLSDGDRELLALLKERKLPHLVVFNKTDLTAARPLPDGALAVSALTGEGIEALKIRLGGFAKTAPQKWLVRDLIDPGDRVVLVIPIDESAPKGRLILPQQQVMREVLDAHAAVVACQDADLKATLAGLREPPRLIVTDSQAFEKVAADAPPDVPLTSFSILFARYKGDLAALVKGAAALSRLKDGDKVLISEGCTHHRQCRDIGTVKLPGWIESSTGAKPDFTFTAGGDFPADLSGFALVVHCGGCMLNEAEMRHRLAVADAAGVPMVNYGVAIAQMHGVLRRSLEPFPDLLPLLDKKSIIKRR
ncbi:MAG: [FeFe] hydrogenase H-cluster maturation GTPase HydF [Acutalibacteraceae bacterium]|jgi:[FeFe] hydrogenase H-cluster maturation GTPase HydF